MRFSRAVNRNPYPIPDVSSEGFWLADGPILGRNVSPSDRNWSSRLGVSDRLFAHHTLNSIRRDKRFIRNMVPNDGLDFALSSIYTHSDDFMVPKNYVPMQPETLNLKTWRVLRNELSPETSRQKPRGKKVRTRVDISAEDKRYPVKSNQPSGNKLSAKIVRRGRSRSPGAEAKQLKQSRGHEKKSPVDFGRKSPSKKRPVSVKKSSPNRKNYRRVASVSRERIQRMKKVPQAVGVSKSSSGWGARGKTAPSTSSGTGAYTLSRAKHKTTSGQSREPVGDDVLDKEQRRRTHAAQMLPIERIHPSSLKLAVDGPHSDLTNPGYSRKIDGTFYGI